MTMDVPKARPKDARPFTVLDGMILVGAIAVGLAPIRWIDPDDDLWSLILLMANSAWGLELFEQVADMMVVFAMPTAMALTLAVLGLRLRRPRPLGRRLARRPGVVAGLAAPLGWATGATFAVVNVLSIDAINTTPAGVVAYSHDPKNYLLAFSYFGSILAGFAVVVAWSTQALAGRWRAEPTWVDRLGRLVGLGWVAMALAGMSAVRVLTI